MTFHLQHTKCRAESDLWDKWTLALPESEALPAPSVVQELRQVSFYEFQLHYL